MSGISTTQFLQAGNIKRNPLSICANGLFQLYDIKINKNTVAIMPQLLANVCFI